MIKRKLLEDLRNHLAKKEITLIVGPRQAGKTTLMKVLQQELNTRGEKSLYLNLDFETDKKYFDTQTKLLRKILLELGEKKGYVFIDEIQRKEDAGIFFKGLYDMDLPYKFILSGSGSVELKEHIHESLAGRKQTFELSTLTFEEFINYKTDYKYEDRLKEFITLEKNKTVELLEEYMNYGGYPRVVLENEMKEKSRIMAELYQSYLERDISLLLGIQKSSEFTSLVKMLASQIGNLTNITELSNTLGLSSKTVKNYLWYMEKTYLIKKVTPFFRNTRKEITKNSLYYFHDLGLRNYILGIFGHTIEVGGIGHLFENLVFNLLKEKIAKSSMQIHFWRTKDKAEVDFILDAGLEVIPIEVKYQYLKKPEITRSFHSFISKYNPKKGYVIHLGENYQDNVNTTKLFIVPCSDLIYSQLPNFV